MPKVPQPAAQRWSPLLFIAALLWAGCSEPKKSWPDGIKEKFLVPLTYPDSEWSAEDFGKTLSADEKSLLRQHLPKVFIALHSPLPVDFYNDYLKSSRLLDADGQILFESTDRGQLKKYERAWGHYLDYTGPVKKCENSECLPEAPIYGRVYHETFSPGKEVIVLKYTLAFPVSGLPAKMSWFQSLGATLAGDKENWHELDIHGGIHLFLDKTTQKPFLLLLAQHNHFETVILDSSHEPLEICFSVRSNEPYVCPKKETFRRAIGDPTNIDYLVNGENGFWLGSHDLIQPKGPASRPLKTRLETLPDRDPLYVSWISLGDEQKLFGIFPSFFRSGPPGIDMNTWPSLRSYSEIAQFWYFEKGDEKSLQLFKENMKDFFDANPRPVLEHNKRKLLKKLK